MRGQARNTNAPIGRSIQEMITCQVRAARLLLGLCVLDSLHTCTSDQLGSHNQEEWPLLPGVSLQGPLLGKFNTVHFICHTVKAFTLQEKCLK